MKMDRPVADRARERGSLVGGFAIPVLGMRPVSFRLGLAALATLAFASTACAESACGWSPTPPTELAASGSVADYRSTLLACRNPGGSRGVAIRTMTIAGTPLMLLADHETLLTRIERAACWTCEPASDDSPPAVAICAQWPRPRRCRELPIAASCRTPASFTAPLQAPSSPGISARAAGRSTGASSRP